MNIKKDRKKERKKEMERLKRAFIYRVTKKKCQQNECVKN